MKFSVIIPLYNKAPYIRKALESVFAQTYTDFELIIVDDGSTDNSASIAEEFIRTSRLSPFAFRLIKQSNAGVSAARNTGVAASSGENIAFLDADDWWEPTYLERMAKLIEDYPEAGLYGMNYIYYKPGKTRVALKCKTGYINYPKEYYEGSAMMIFTSSSSMPKRVFEEMGGFPLGIRLGEDFLLWAKTALHHKVAFCDEPLAYYNNDVPATLRATRNLHKPEYHMLFNLEAYLQLLPEGKRNVTSPKSPQPTPSPFLKEGEHASFAKTWGAHTADSTQYDLLKENAKANRKNPTEAESAMWDMLKGNNIGYHFRRQHIILDYIVDFICLDKGLVIELDGGYHNDPQQKEYDELRTAHLQRLGYTELRFTNEEFLCNPDAVINKITETLEQLPSLQGGELPGLGSSKRSNSGERHYDPDKAGDRLFFLPFREETEVGPYWKLLLDKLRVNGLLDYWMSKEYHDLAAEELKKVDWSKQPASVKRIYKTPIWMLKAKRLIMRWGSFVKQGIIKVIGERL